MKKKVKNNNNKHKNKKKNTNTNKNKKTKRAFHFSLSIRERVLKGVSKVVDGHGRKNGALICKGSCTSSRGCGDLRARDGKTMCACSAHAKRERSQVSQLSHRIIKKVNPGE